MKIRRRSIKAGYAVDDILWVLDGDDDTWKTWGSAGPKKKSMSKEELIDALNAEGNNYIDVLITKNGENPDDYGYTETIKDKFVKSGCTKKSVKASAIMEADDISGVKILVRSEAYVDITEDNYEHGASTSISNQWDFDVRGEYDSMQALIDDIHSVSYQVFSDNIDDYSFGDGALRTSAMVNDENDVPTDEEYEAFKRGEITLYIADMWLPLEAGSVHDMTDDEAENFGIKEIW